MDEDELIVGKEEKEEEEAKMLFLLANEANFAVFESNVPKSSHSE